MTTKSRSEVHVDAVIAGNFPSPGIVDLDVFAIGSRGLPLACPLCKHIGPFSCGLMIRGVERITRSYTCPTCLCIVTVTIRV